MKLHLLLIAVAGASAALNVTAQVLSIVAGDRQTVRRSGAEVPGGIAQFEPLSVVLKDANGTPLPNRAVEFECSPRRQDVVCQLATFQQGTPDTAPVLATLTPSGWATVQGQLVAYAQATAGAAAGASKLLGAVPLSKQPVVTVNTDEKGVASLRRMRGKSVWAYGGTGSLVVTARHQSRSVQFHLTVAN